MLTFPSSLDFPRANGLGGRFFLAAVLVVLAALPLLLLMPLFQAPFEPDQGVYAVIAKGWLAGDIPYRDLWDNKGPLLFLWFAMAFQGLGEGSLAPRLLAAMAAAASVPFVWASGVALLGQRLALLAALLFATSFANLFLQANANAEIFMLLPLVAGFCCFAKGARGDNLPWFAAAGALTALAVLTKQTAVWTLPAYLFWLGALALRHPLERGHHLKAMGLLLVGVALAFAPFAAYFHHHGALYDFWYATFAFNVSFASQFSVFSKLIPPLVGNPLPLIGGAAFWFLALLGTLYLWRRGDRRAWLILLFLLSAEIAAQSLGKSSPHYNVQLLPAAALAGAVGLQVVIENWRAGQRRLGQLLAVCLALSVAASAFVYAWPTAEGRFLAQYGFTSYADNSVEAQEIAQRVAALTTPGSYIYDFGRQSQIYFLADRLPASRWVHNRAYEVDTSIMEEILRDLEAKQASLILLTFQCGPSSQEFSGCETGPPAELKAYLDQHYRYAGRLHYAEFYLRLEGGGG